MDGNGQPAAESKLRTYVIAGSLGALVIGAAVFGLIIYRARVLNAPAAPAPANIGVVAKPAAPTGQPVTTPTPGGASVTAGTPPAVSAQPTGAAAAPIPLPGQAANPIPKKQLYNTPDYTNCLKKPGQELNECEKLLMGPDWQKTLERDYPGKGPPAP